MLQPVSIRINILSNFLIVIVLISTALLALQYYFSQQLALSAAHNHFIQTTKVIAQHIQSRDRLTKNMLNYTELYPNLTLAPGKEANIETIKRFAHNMQRSINIYAMYVGHDKGDFFQVINMQVTTALLDIFNAPENTRWTVIKIYNNNNKVRIRQFDFYDAQFNIISTRQSPSDYQANARPWFIQAKQNKQAIRTDPYLFSNLKQQGITFAKVIHQSTAVLGIDFTLSRLNEFLQHEKIDPSSDLVLFGQNKRIIASSNISSDKSQAIETFLTQMLDEQQVEKIIHYKAEGIDKFVMLSKLSTEQGNDTYIGLTIDARVMLDPFLKKIYFSIVIALVFLIISIPFVLYMTTRIIKPIKALMTQNSLIKHRDFSQVRTIDTNIVELLDLSHSLVTMSQSIQSYQTAQQALMDSFIRLIAEAIDSKSAYTGGHCQRVPEIAMMLARSASDSHEGELSQFSLDSDDAWREFEMGALLHDCGKVTTPEYVVDKATKLETIYNRIHEIRTRFEVLWRDIEIEYYQRLAKGETPESLLQWKQTSQQALQDDFLFISEVNMGGEFMSTDKKERIHQIAQRTWLRHFNDRLGLSEVELIRYKDVAEPTLPVIEQLLSDKAEHRVARHNFDHEAYKQQGFKLDVPEFLYDYGEIYNLCVEKGTLTEEERFKINEHVIMTIKMLEMLPFPKHMQKIPEYAGTHHETMIHTGYPRQLGKEQLSIPARIMAIADIFEALTASDRPYKKGKTISEAIQIMSFMKQDKHIDGEIFELFLRSKTYLHYAKKHLKAEQIDEVDIESYIL